MVRVVHSFVRAFLALGLVLSSAGLGYAKPSDCFESNPAVAIPACDAALADTDRLTPSKTAQYRRARAAHLVETNDFVAALADLDALADYDQTTAPYHLLRARALLGLSRSDQSLKAVSSGLALEPLHVPSLLFRTTLLIETGDPDAAIADAGLAATLEPDNPETNTAMAQALEAVGATEAAKRSAEAALVVPEPEPEPVEEVAQTPSAPAVENEPSALELTFWNDVKNSGSVDEIEAFLMAFPDSVFAPLARLRMSKMSGSVDAIPAQPVPAVVSQPAEIPTIPFDLKHATGRENLAWSIIDLPGGDLIASGSYWDAEETQSNGWGARISQRGNVIWEDIPKGAGDATTTSAVLQKNGTLIMALIAEADDRDLRAINLRGLSPDGQVLWQKGLGTTAKYLGFSGLMALDSGGAIVTTTSAAENKSGMDSRVLRISDQGDVIWDRTFPLPGADFVLRAVEGEQGIYVLGNFDIDETSAQNLRILQLSLDGELVWEKVFPSPQSRFGTALAILPGGDLVVAGSEDTDDESDVWVSRITQDGSTVWETALDYGFKDDTFAIAVLPTGEIAIVGSTRSTDNWKSRAGWITWLDDNGSVLARRFFGDSEEENLFSAAALSDGGLAVAGNLRVADSDDYRLHIFTVPALKNIAASWFAAENNALIKECEAQTAHSDDIQKMNTSAGVSWADIDPDTAITTCELALAAFPKHAQTLYQMGRVLHNDEQSEKALEYFRRAADLGYIRGMAGAGLILTSELEHLRDAAEGARFFQAAADMNDPISAGELAGLYRSGTGVDKDLGRSAELFEQAARGGLAYAQYRTAQVFDNGWGVEKDSRKALDWYRAAAEQDHAAATYELAYYYKYGFLVPKDKPRAMELYSTAAELGDGRAMEEMGRIFEFGEGVTSDYVTAANWYQRASDAGQAGAQASLGYLYEFGLGVSQDDAKALELFRASADAENPQGLYQLGRAYDRGYLIERDAKLAVRYYSQAVEMDYGSALSALAFFYRDGDGVAKDEAKAYDLFKQAADRNYLIGLREAGWLSYLGRGTEKDLLGGMNLITLAADGSDGLASIYLGYILENEPSVYNAYRAAQRYFDGLRAGQTNPITRSSGSWDRETAKALQRLLRDAGYYAGAIDGQVGPGTVGAMKAFCQCE